jgi:hypothetical protein
MVNILTPALSASGCAGCDPPLLGLFCESIQPVQTTCQKYKLATYDRKKHRTTSEKQPPPLNSRAEFAAGFDLTTSHRVRRAQSQLRRAAEPFLRPKPGSVHRCLQSCRQIRSWGALRKMEKAKRSARSGKKRCRVLPIVFPIGISGKIQAAVRRFELLNPRFVDRFSKIRGWPAIRRY